MAYDPNNIFAKILRGEAPCIKVYEDEKSLAFMDVMPQVDGHTLVIPKAPAENLFDLPPEDYAALAVATQTVAAAVKKAMKAPGIMIAQLNGAEAGQTVFHFHNHILPRAEGIELKFHARSLADFKILEQHAEKIRACLLRSNSTIQIISNGEVTMLKSFKLALMGGAALVAANGLGSNMVALAAEARNGYTLETIIAPSAFHGIHGLTFTKDGKLLAGSVLGRAIYEINIKDGTTSTYIGAPTGMADDLEEGPNGELGWTAFLEGKYYLRTKSGDTLTLAEGLPGLNSTAWSPDGRLFATQVFLGDALYELDPKGVNPPRKIIEGLGGLNGFDFGPDGKLYGPLWFKGVIVRVDVDTGEMETVADGFKVPAAANFDSKGNLWVVDTAAGHLVHVNVETSETSVVARVKPSIDNLAIDARDQIYISNMADNAILHVNTETGEAHPIVTGTLAVAADIAHGRNTKGEETIFIGDLFSFRTLDVATGKVDEIGRVFGANIDYPISVGVNGDKLALAGWSAGMVQTYDAATGSLGAIHHNFTTPTDALPLPNGDVLVAEYARGALVRVDGNDWAKRTDIATDLAGPTSLLAGKDGTVLVSENLCGAITEINLETGARTVLASGLAGPEGFDQADDGTLYIAEVGTKSISRVSPDGTKMTIGADLPIGFAGPDDGLPVYVPTGVVLSNAGDVYFTADEEAALYRLSQGSAQ